MFLVGTREQLKLAHVLQRIESHAKNGSLVVKQGEQSVELYFQQGRLICTGPLKPDTTLGERLLRAGIISPQAQQELIFVVGTTQFNEIRTALTLMDLGYISQDSLRAWVAEEVRAILRVLLTWSNAEISFEEEKQPPPDRLLIPLSVTSLLPALASERADPVTGPVDPSAGPAYISAMQLISASSLMAPATSPLPSPELPSAPLQPLGYDSSSIRRDTLNGSPALHQAPVPAGNSTTLNLRASGISQPAPVTAPLTTRRIDTSFMLPDMVLVPTDLSSLREQNPHVPLTPEQWQLFSLADGHTSLKTARQLFNVPSELLCQVAGELVALGLVQVFMPPSAQVYELSPVSQNLVTAGLANGYLAPGYAASSLQPWAAMPVMGVMDNRTPSQNRETTGIPVETQSQWGNGDSGMFFVPGHGWIRKSSRASARQAQDASHHTGSSYRAHDPAASFAFAPR